MCGRDLDDIENPRDFVSERRLGAADNRSYHFAWGYETRMCVASHVAHNAPYTVYSHLLSHFKILPSTGGGSETITDPLKKLINIGSDGVILRGLKRSLSREKKEFEEVHFGPVKRR